MKRLVLASYNQGKLNELQARLEGLECEVISLADLDEDLEVVEDEGTFEGNAIKKTRAAADSTGYPALADDSGLEVDALGGRPGVCSARYGGPGLDDRGRYELLLKELSDVPKEKRTARFRAVLVYLKPGGSPRVFEGTVEGIIADTPSGTHGFGYDPVFIPNGYNDSMAVLGPEIKNRISHRAKALDSFVRFFRSTE